MKCEICHQNEAETVIFRPKKDGGRPEELYVCHACAEREQAFGRERGIQVAALDSDSIADMPETGMPPGPNPGLPPFNLPNELLGKIGEAFTEMSKHMHEGAESQDGLSSDEAERCPCCGMPIDELRHQSLAGCPQCYKTYRKLIRALLEQIQQSPEFHGDAFPGAERERDIGLLKKQQREAVENEDYTQAKQLRSQIDFLSKCSDEGYADVPKCPDDIDDPAGDDDGDDDDMEIHSGVLRDPAETVKMLKDDIALAERAGNAEMAGQLRMMLEMVLQAASEFPESKPPRRTRKASAKKAADKKPVAKKPAAKKAADKKPAAKKTAAKKAEAKKAADKKPEAKKAADKKPVTKKAAAKKPAAGKPTAGKSAPKRLPGAAEEEAGQ